MEQPLESVVAVCVILRLCGVSMDQVVRVAGVANMLPIGGTSMACGGEPLNVETLMRRGLPTTLQDCGRSLGTSGLWLGCSACGGPGGSVARAVTRGDLLCLVSTSSSAFSFPGMSTWDDTQIHCPCVCHKSSRVTN